MKRFLFLTLTSLFAVAVMAETEVYTPSLKSPTNNSTRQLPNVYLSWNPVAGSTDLQYRLQLDTTSTFSSGKLVDTTIHILGGYKTHELFLGQKYFWRVKAIDQGQSSAWSVMWNFTVFDTVVLTKPANNAQQDTISPYQVLVWSNQVTAGGVKVDISGIRYFDIQIDTSAGFNSPLLRNGTVAAGTNYISTNKTYFLRENNLRFGTKYYWRARARHNLSTGPWCPPWNFKIAKYPKLQLPATGAKDQFLDVKMSWANLKGVMAWEYQLAKDTGFINIIAMSEVDTNFTRASYTRFGNVYYWRARARNQADTSDWCPKYSFTTIDKVILNSPINNAVAIALKPTMKWTGQSGIVGYHLQIATDNSFSSPYVDLRLSDTLVQVTLTKKLSPNTVYYWRMRAFSDTDVPDTTSWGGTPWSFTTTDQTGIGETDALNSSIYPNPASGKVNLRFDLTQPAVIQADLVDLLGKTVLRETFDLGSGLNLRELSLSGISKGIYIIKLSSEGSVSNHKLIVDK